MKTKTKRGGRPAGPEYLRTKVVRVNKTLLDYAKILFDRAEARTADAPHGSSGKVWLDGDVDAEPSAMLFSLKTRPLSETEVLNMLITLGSKEMEKVIVGKEGRFDPAFAHTHKGLGEDDELKRLAAVKQGSDIDLMANNPDVEVSHDSLEQATA